ncbi:glucose PTS transporter subunit IIA [Corynebacterium sp. sy039]|uniref:glucose PTS transporter subunit IIA n=1 Tax=Corynebacterium sp. sy039 TaxID=2599641 RepID=UPI0011B80914|nr:glucose PTS transporter subunit IIA [Corynebacterium sp. sy039]QDZ42521.1 PTS beta-glucoside transporter subunit EIIBCA [Corynebacterium sp. sy039]
MATAVAQTAEFIVEHVGGADNISSLTHCATRLRFQLNDRLLVDREKLDQHPDILGVVEQGNNGLQVVMGGGVANYYQQIVQLPGMSSAIKDDDSQRTSATRTKKEYGGVREKYSWLDYSFEFLSDTFRPILWALLGASLIITLLVIADTLGWQEFRADLSTQPAGYQLLHAMYQSVFYFLPIMIGATASKKLGVNEWVGAAIPAALLTPEFIGLSDIAQKINFLGGQAQAVEIFGIPLILNSYSGQVFPPILAAIGLFFVEKILRKIFPEAVQMVFVPFFSLLIMIPLTAFLLGPFGIGIGNGISHMLNAINSFSPFIMAIIIPLLYPFLVPLGLHWPLNAIMIVNINTLGYDFIQGPMGAWNFACFGVVAGVLLLSIREKDTAMRQVSFGGLMAGLFGGISEPSLYGVLLRFKKTYFSLLPGCFIGGIVMGIFNVKANAFVFSSIFSVGAMTPGGGYALGLLVAFFTSFFLVVSFDYRAKAEKQEILARLNQHNNAEPHKLETKPTAANSENKPTSHLVDNASQEKMDTNHVQHSQSDVESGTAAEQSVSLQPAVKTALVPGTQTDISSPLEGEAVALSQVPDPIFATEKLGKGIAINPTGNQVVAPAPATVISVQKSGHAVGLRLDNGIELLIHIGIDTVQLGGRGFEVHVERKERVVAGQKLISFDPKYIKTEGYDLITPVLVVNTKKFAEVVSFPADSVDDSTTIIRTTAPERAE